MEPNYWKASWILCRKTSEPEAHRYFVTHFEADPDQLSKVVFQGASDDRGTVYLNGKAAVKINGWAIPAVNENLKSLLVKGKNTLAVDAFNVGGSSGFLGELNLVGKDGNVTSIASGTDWKASERLTPGWNQPVSMSPAGPPQQQGCGRRKYRMEKQPIGTLRQFRFYRGKLHS